MEDLPTHLQSRIYGEAGVHGVCTTSRDELFRAALLADQRDLDAPFEEGEDSPAPSPTWRVAGMVPASPDTDIQFAAALERLAMRYSQLQHVSLDLSEHDSQPTKAGLSNFLEHGSAALSHATRLTIRGVYSRPMCDSAPLPWHKLAATRLRFSCTRLDVTLDEETLEPLLSNLSRYFPAAQHMRVRVLPIPCTDPIIFLSVDAPDSLTHLQLLMSTLPSAAHCRAAVTIEQADCLQELSVRFLTAPPPGFGTLAGPASCGYGGSGGGGGGGGGSSGRGSSNDDGGGGRDHRTFVTLRNVGALHTLRGYCHLDPRMHDGVALALPHVEATFQGGAVHETGLPRDVKAWLQEWDARQGLGLASMRLRVCGLALTVVEANALLAWAATSSRHSLVLAA